MNQSFLLSCVLIPLLPCMLVSCINISPGQIDGKTSIVAVSGEKSAVSGILMPEPGNKVVPSGKGCNLSVLNWAGFDGAASYSFDDGQPSHIDHWKDLKAAGVPMTFYLVPTMNASDSNDEIWKEALSLGCELGNHTGTHKRISEYAGLDEISGDIDLCSDYLKNKLGQTGPCSFAYPFGETDWKKAFRGQFLLARSVYTGTIKPLDKTDPLSLPIFPVNGSHTEKSFNDALDKSVSEKSWVIFMFHSILPGANWYAGVPIDSITGSITHAKAGGRLWIDTVERIGAYWLAQKQFAGLEPQGDANSKTWVWSLPEHFPSGLYLRVCVDGGTLSQNNADLPWNKHGFYEVALDAGKLEWRQ